MIATPWNIHFNNEALEKGSRYALRNGESSDSTEAPFF